MTDISVVSESRGSQRGLLADRAYRALRDRLVTLRIPPGSPIDEDAIGRELKMGRTPVREAIKRLAHENLVTVFPRRGTFASEINITDLAHISDVRAQLEGHAAYRAAERITDAQRAELAGLLVELDVRRGADDLEMLMDLDATVHRFIYRCAGNPYMEETLGRYLEDEDAEVRRAAALGLAMKESTAHVRGLIGLLLDPEPSVQRAAHAALCSLSGQDFGPRVNATEAEKLEAAARWRKWWGERR